MYMRASWVIFHLHAEGSYSLKYMFQSLKAMRHPTPGQASETISHLITAILIAGSAAILSLYILQSSKKYTEK